MYYKKNENDKHKSICLKSLKQIIDKGYSTVLQNITCTKKSIHSTKFAICMVICALSVSAIQVSTMAVDINQNNPVAKITTKNATDINSIELVSQKNTSNVKTNVENEVKQKSKTEIKTEPVENKPVETIKTIEPEPVSNTEPVVYKPQKYTTNNGTYTIENDVVWQTLSVPTPNTVENTGQKTYMDYRTITNKSSMQYQLQKDPYVWTDELGLRRYGNHYMVAMGTYYGSPGDILRITLTSGQQFTVILGDIKSDLHTDPTHRHKNGNIVEFIIDKYTLQHDAKFHGDISYASPQFQGAIASVEKWIP